MAAKTRSQLSADESRAALRRVLRLIRPYAFFVLASLICAAVSCIK